MSFIYCHENRRKQRWYYQESPGFRERVSGSSSSFVIDKSAAYRFASREEAWEHCRMRRRGGFWTPGKWIVIRLRDTPNRSEGSE